jgi:hypothetical protein
VLRDALSGTHFQSGPEISCDQEKMRGEDKVEALFCFILFLKSLLRVLFYFVFKEPSQSFSTTVPWPNFLESLHEK